MSDAASDIIGIDLGTTNSLVAIFQDGRPRLIRNAYGHALTPSVVAVVDDGAVIVGDPARDYRVTHPDRCSWAFKRWMGTDRRVKLGGRTFTPPELSSLILRALREDAEKHLGRPVTAAVVTVPAYFNDHQRKATRLAGQLAGLDVRRIINEPTAAALTYGFHDRAAEKKLIVIDLGGGTFDVTLMDVADGVLEIISTAGESFLGGEDFTDRLVAAVLVSRGSEFEATEHRHPLLVSRLRSECEAAKRRLAEHETAVVRMPDERGELTAASPSVEVTRASFKKDVALLLQRLHGPIGKALGDGRTAAGEVDDVILVGGATRMPAVIEAVRERFGREPTCTFDPDEVVALGAAVQGALIADDAAVEDMVMTDVCPHTLGVEISKTFGGHLEPGFFSPLIHRNTKIPVSREGVYCTVQDCQTELTLRIYQGESRRVKDNLYLGALQVTGVPPGPAGQQVVTRFTYDLNGILEVEVFVAGSQKRFQTVLADEGCGLSSAEISEAVERMQAVKFYPRDELVNVRLVRFCERAVGEVSLDHRRELEAALDHFEVAMSSGDRDVFEEAREHLLAVLAQTGIDYSDESDGDS